MLSRHIIHTEASVVTFSVRGVVPINICTSSERVRRTPLAEDSLLYWSKYRSMRALYRMSSTLSLRYARVMILALTKRRTAQNKHRVYKII